MKACTKCGQKKELSEFYSDKRNKNGAYASCKTCIRKPYKRPKWTKEYRNKYTEAYRKRPDQTAKVKARSKARYAVKSGKILKLPCQVCGSEKSEAHHEDYSKPLDVVWYCPLHHKRRHMQMLKEKED